MGELFQLSDETKMYVTNRISVTLKDKPYSTGEIQEVCQA
jgi:hypothetical protein